MHIFNNSYVSVLTQGGIGTAIPVFGLAFGLDQWSAPLQLALGGVVPTLTAVNLYYLAKKNRKESMSADKDFEYREMKMKFYRNRRQQKQKRKHKNETKKPDDVNSPDDLIDNSTV